MSNALRRAIEHLQPEQWQPMGEGDAEVIQSCAEVPFVSAQESNTRHSTPLRYVAIRVQKRQGELFSDGSSTKHFAVLTNIWEWSASKLIQWHREKAGTIEPVHDVVKNELAAGVMPCGRFGANAAWLRLAVLSHNVLTALKRIALPPELLRARPKRLRFLIFNTAGQVIHHARKITLRIATSAEKLQELWLNTGRVLAAAPA